MAEELQSLLEKIQKDGVDKARDEASQILADARKQADEITRKAEQDAQERREGAEKEAEAFARRGRRALDQAARDVRISLRGAIEETLRALVRSDVARATDATTLVDLLKRVVDAYCGDRSGTTTLEIAVPDEVKDEVAAHFLGRLTEEMKKGVTIKGDAALVAGFRVSIVDDRVEHDFSDEAMTDALCALLRPHLADIVKSAGKED